MNHKILAALAVAALAMVGALVIVGSEDSDAATVTLNAKTLYESSTSSYSYSAGTVVSIIEPESGGFQYDASPNSFTLSAGSTQSVTLLVYDIGEQTEQGTRTITFTGTGTVTYTMFAGIESGTGTVYIQNVTKGTQTSPGASASLSASAGDTIRFYAVPGTGYRLDSWWDSSTEQYVGNANPYTYIATESKDLIATFEAIPTYTMFAGIESGTGTVYIQNVTAGTSTVAGSTATMTANSGDTIRFYAVPGDGYYLDSWWDSSTEQYVGNANPYTYIATESKDLIATFVENEPPESVMWSNDNYNGRIDILFQFDKSNNKAHTMEIPLYSGTVADNKTTWTQSSYTLQIDISSPTTVVTVTLQGSTIPAKSLNLYSWNTFVVSIDSEHGKVSVTPVKLFRNFMDYTLADNQTTVVMDFGSVIKNVSMYTIEHSETGAAANSAKFSVVRTSTFLDTYGVVLYNPTINVYDYFPQYSSVRLNFYSFALYGESFTVNGQTYVLDGSNVTVDYVQFGSDNYLPDVMPNERVQHRTLELSNIYITWDGSNGHVYLTFVNDRFTIDLGTFVNDQRIVSFSGVWYFTSMVYEPYTATEKVLGEWKPLPTLSSVQMLLIYLGLLAVGAVIAAIHIRRSGLGWLDLAIIIAAAIVGYILLEGF